MNFDRLFVGVTYFVAGLGLAVVALTGHVPWVVLAATAVAGGLSSHRFRRVHPSDRAWRVSSRVFLLGCSLAVIAFRQPWLDVALYLTLFLQVNRLFVRRTDLDYLYVYLMAFLHVLVGTVLIITPVLALFLVAFLVASTLGLALLQVRIGMHRQVREIDRALGAGGASSRFADGVPAEDGLDAHTRAMFREASALLSPGYLLGTGLVSMVMLAGTVSLFLIIPRLELNALQRSRGRPVHVAGFSDEVRLGEVGRILGGHDRVMRVKLEHRGPPAGTPYWRGVSLDRFDGRTWRRAHPFRERYRTLDPVAGHGPPAETDLVQHYMLERIDSPYLFVLPRVLGIAFSTPFVWHYYDDVFESPVQGRKKYVVYGSVRTPRPEDLRSSPRRVNRFLSATYLQLPELSPDVKRLAEQVTTGSTNDYDRVVALRDYLRTHYTYTTEPSSRGDAPLEDFLFRTQAGHCEYYASALVVLCRALGVPARLVNGFLGGEYNEIGDYWVVRQSNAHSWAEVWFSGWGWVRFDATPAGQTAGQVHRASLSERLEQYLDYAEMRWYFYILDYDLTIQLDVVSRLLPRTRWYARSRGAPPGPPRRSRRTTAGHWGLLVAIGLVTLAVWRLSRRTRSGRPPGAVRGLTHGPGRRFVRNRRKIHGMLERMGYEKRPGETPLERAERAGQALGDQGRLASVERRYYAARFGGKTPRFQDAESAEKVLRWLKRHV